MALQPGDIFVTRYRVDGRIGSGGFGDVYLVTDLRTQQVAALKLLRAVDEQARARFAREVAIVGRLKSPHTVRLLDSGVAAGGLHYAVFEYVAGEDLSKVLGVQGKLPLDVVDRILRQLLSSLDEAHRLGLLHRDLKPENIRVFEADGDPWRVKLLDFGIARATDGGHPNLTETGELVGTPRYMSPEQLSGNPLTQASDLYSLGIVLFEMIVGRDAVHGNAWGDQIDRMATDWAPNYAALAQAGPLRDAALKMMQKHPRNRAQTVAQVLAILDGPATVEVREEAPRGQPWRAVGLAVAVVSIAAFAWAAWPEREAPRPQPRTMERENPFAEKTDATSPPRVPTEVRPKPVAPSLPLTGCGADPPFVGSGVLRSDFTATSGTYTHVPRTYGSSREHPLVLLLHDDMQTPESFLDGSGFARLADQRGFVVMAPASTAMHAWDGEDEHLTVLDAIDLAAERLCIDRERVYAVGQGTGGQQAFEMLCEDEIRAAAKNNHRIRGSGRKCAKPLIVLNATRSRYSPIEGGLNCQKNDRKSAKVEDEIWRRRLGCGDAAQPWYAEAHGSCETWTCEAPFVSCVVHGGGAWPGTPGRAGVCGPETSSRFPTTERVWAFFDERDGGGCGVDPPFVGEGRLETRGVDWLTYIPERAGSAPMPMLMLLHQAEETPESFLEDTGFAALADKHNFVIVAPNGGTDAWKGFDSALLDMIADETASRLCIDRTRQFLVGHGQGGRPVERLSCGSWVDGIVTNSHRSAQKTHHCDRPIPHMTLSGTRSRYEPVDGGKNCRQHDKLSLADWEVSWAERNRCGEARREVVKHGESKCFEYGDCEAPLVSCHLDGGHGWPGSNPRPSVELFMGCDGTPPDFPSAEEIWKFFSELE